MIRTVISDSDMDSLTRLKTLLANFPNTRVIGEAYDGEEAVSIIDGLKPDLLFLNLQLPALDGLEVLRTVSYRPTVIFTTSYNRYIVNAFEEHSIDYLLKPFSRERFEKTLRIAVQRSQKFTHRQVEILEDATHKTVYLDRFAVKVNQNNLIVPAVNVFFFQEKNHHVYLHTFDNKFLCDIPLRELENLLDSERFCRVNKYDIVAPGQVEKLRRDIRGKQRAVLKDQSKTALIVDKNYGGGLREKLQKFL